jgi:hypothetical protein
VQGFFKAFPRIPAHRIARNFSFASKTLGKGLASPGVAGEPVGLSGQLLLAINCQQCAGLFYNKTKWTRAMAGVYYRNQLRKLERVRLIINLETPPPAPRVLRHLPRPGGGPFVVFPRGE